MEARHKIRHTTGLQYFPYSSDQRGVWMTILAAAQVGLILAACCAWVFGKEEDEEKLMYRS